MTRSMAGPAIRAWEMASALAGSQEVVLATTSGVCERRSDRFGVEAAGPGRFAELERWCDVAVVQGYVLERVPILRNSRKVMIVDLYDPIFLEDLELNRAWPEPERTLQMAQVIRVFAEQARRGDFFLCASEKQRDMWLGFLSAVGRINPATFADDPSLRSLIDVAAFGLPNRPPTHSGQPAIKGAVEGIGPDDRVVLWGGGVYDWLDPVTAIRAIDELKESHPDVRLFFMGVRHPNPDAKESRALEAARRLAGELELTGRFVFFNETWVPYELRADHLLEADLGISLHQDHVETAYSFRTRLLDCIWAGLPTVATRGDTFAGLIQEEGLGRVVPAGDAKSVALALGELLSSPSERDACRARAREIAPRFAWSAVLEPLVRACMSPTHAADSDRRRPTETTGGKPPTGTGRQQTSPEAGAGAVRQGPAAVRQGAGAVRQGPAAVRQGAGAVRQGGPAVRRAARRAGRYGGSMLRFLASARSSGYRRLSHGDVDLCYRLLLDRPADPDALAHYRHKARANGMSILDLVGELLGSPEYSMVARRRLATPISTVVDAGDFRIHVLPGDHAVGQALAATSTYEKEVSDTIVGVLRPGAVFLDIGANYGWHTLLAATSVGPTGRAIAVEPNPANAELLRRSVVENGLENVTVVVSAAGQHEGIGGLETDGSNGRIIDLDGDLREAVACSYVVPVRPVDKIVEQTDLARVDVVKIDVEGLESAVLAGAAGTIARDHPVIVTEFFPRALDWTGGVEPRSYLQQLRSMGYRLSVIGGEPSVTDDRIMDLSSHTDHLDLLAVPD